MNEALEYIKTTAYTQFNILDFRFKPQQDSKIQISTTVISFKTKNVKGINNIF